VRPAEVVTDEGPEGRRIAGLTCAELADLLPALVDGPVGRRRVDRRVGRHLDQCLRCQAEISGYRRLLKALHAVRTEVLEPPGGAVTGVLAVIAAEAERHASRALLHRQRILYAAGLTGAAAAAGAGAAVVVLSRRRRFGDRSASLLP
jgi:hypothetical protein